MLMKIEKSVDESKSRITHFEEETALMKAQQAVKEPSGRAPV